MNSRVFYRMSERKTYHEKEKENEVQVIIDPWHFSLSMSFHEVLVSEIEDNDTKGLIHDSLSEEHFNHREQLEAPNPGGTRMGKIRAAEKGREWKRGGNSHRGVCRGWRVERRS